MKYDLVIFDCDGVIVDSEPIANKIFADLINDLGYNLSYELAFQAYEKELKTVEGVADIISMLKFEDFCVASNAPEKKIHKALTVTGLFPKFKGRIFSSSMVERPKPFPDLFLHAAHKMSANPKNCVVIEDSPFGVRAAVSAGMDVFGYCKRTDRKILENAGAKTFNDMALLKELLDLNH